MQISKEACIKLFYFTYIFRGCIAIENAIDFLEKLKVILTYDNVSSIERLAGI